MPTIKFSLKELERLLGRKISETDLGKLLSYCKAEVDNYDKATGDVTADFGDTNLPYLWSIEGVARLLKGVIGKEKGIPKVPVKNSKYELIVDESVLKVRPYIVSFAAKGAEIDDYLLRQMVQLQEKLCDNFGRRRQKIAIGIYRLNKIRFPVHYRAVDPGSIRFVPLDSKSAMTPQEILEMHPKGKEYAWILKGMKKYPILMDSEKNVLSFPPIINSAETGRVEEGDSELFFEATGTDLKLLNLAANIFANALYDRGFDIYSVDVKYGNKTLKTPEFKTEKIKVDEKDIERVLGIALSGKDVKILLEKARYGVTGNVIEIPSYRSDILHSIDVIEDIGIMYGYEKIRGTPLTEYTVGKTFEMTKFINQVRDLVVGQGYQEIMSPILSNNELLCDRMNMKRTPASIEIGNPMSETYSCVRSWLIPLLMDVLSKNKHVDYPQKLFEEGLVTVKKDSEARDYERLAVVSAHYNANFTEIKQAFDYVMRLLGADYTIKETMHDSFVQGRVGRASVNNREVAYIGEINPSVLRNFGLTVPAAAFELNLTELYEELKK